MTIPAAHPYAIDPPMPVPPPRRYTGKYPYRQLNVGESFAVEDKDTAHNAVCCARMWAARVGNGWAFAKRATDAGWRIWRVA
jgi:hypothetical protein